MCIRDRGNGHCVCVLAELLSDKLRTAEHIAPLIVTAELHLSLIHI